MPGISYAITVNDEHVELERLVNILLSNLTENDEIVIQQDDTQFPTPATDLVRDFIKKVCSENRDVVQSIRYPLNGDFAAFKNNLKEYCKKDFILFLDADEYVGESFIPVVQSLIEVNPTVDLFLFPRINTVDGITPEHIQRWGWRVDAQGRVNYPDYQGRLVRRKPEIKWQGKVHEQIEGCKGVAWIPADAEYLALLHPKTIQKQEKQNNLYSTL